jgi:hypothetical protein
MKRFIIAVLATTLLAMPLSARGGGNGGNNPNGGNGGGPHGPGIGRDNGANVIVAADGTVFVVRATVDSTTNAVTRTVTAITPAGATAWTANLPANHGRLVLSGSNLLTLSDAADGTVNTTITALSTATGAVSWTLNVAGRVQELEAFSGGTYAVVVTPATTTAAATRSLVAISNSGAILWTVAL